MFDADLKNAIETLEASAQYRLIKRYEKPDFYHPPDNHVKYQGVFLDVETTGTSIPEDKIIELGLVVFEYGADGRIFRILEEFSQYQDPGKPIPPAIVSLTGITDKMVQNQSLDKPKVFEYLKSADLVIAHYASFDRMCLEAHWPEAPIKRWACTMSEVPWREEGFESAKLEYLAYRYGFFYEGHRASVDCLAGVHLLSQSLPRSQKRVMQALLERSQKPTFRLWALYAPIGKKDILKARRYRWSPDGYGKYKAWFIEVEAERLAEELEFLWVTVYPNKQRLPVEKITARERFSNTLTLKESWIETEAQAQALIQDI